MSTATVNPRIQDFIMPETALKAKPSSDYELVTSNNTDFVVRKKMAKKSKLLAVIPSQGVYYIRDEASGDAEELTLRSLKAFCKDLGDDTVELPETKWARRLSKDRLDRIWSVVENPVYADMCKHKIVMSVEDMEWAKRYWEVDAKLFRHLVSLFPKLSENNGRAFFLPMIYRISEIAGRNEARYFAGRLVFSDMEGETTYYGHDKGITCAEKFEQIFTNPDYRLDFRAFTEYLLFSLYRQGISRLSKSVLTTYDDCLRLQIAVYGRIKDKYPKTLQTSHDILTLKNNLVTQDFRQESAKFPVIMERYKPLAFSEHSFCIVVPEKAAELADEGLTLSHCVKSYIKRVADEECAVLFLRQARKPEVPMVTVQVAGGKVVQAEGYARRQVSQEEHTFLARWAREKELEMAI